MSGCDDCFGAKDLAHTTPAYRRALWVVVLLNAGYGVIEMIGGFLAGSQALKADALDFVGDGSITLLGLLALSWRPLWRSRAALLQGLFLGALGLGVSAAAIYRVFVVNEPEPILMSGFGSVALIVNVVSAWVLSKHREGDANVRAVWLFSRNDAIGNVAVVTAAGFVWLTATAWPDIIVAAGIAGLFLHSSFDIIRDALRELRDHSG
jgi:Co/Zn/Cd efflux system component